MTRFGWRAAAVLLALTAACTPGYMKASQLEARGQGPTACAKSCEDLGMRMAALVLVGNELPGCVCQPLPAPGAPRLGNEPAPANGASSGFNDGAAASTTGYVVLAAAAAARRQQNQAQQNQQNATKKN